jgi:hypothetical protein
MMVDNIRHRTGCGTTAIAQIMKYYEHPKHGIGQSEPYSTGLGTVASSVNLEIDYEWGNMLNIYNSSANQQQVDAVATLMYHIAVSFKINSGAKGTDIGTSITQIITAMTAHFGYDKSMKRLRREFYDDAMWETIIKEQLDTGMPVFYSSPGHYYVIDGYDGNGKFHFNWGWGGQSDGWYSLSVDWRSLGNEDAETNEDGDEQIIIINIKPDAGGISSGYEIALNNFEAQKTAVVHSEQFAVYTYMRNVNPEHRFYGGKAGVALVDNGGNIVAVIGTSNMGEGSLWSRLTDRPINCTVPATVPAGQYRLRIVTRPADGEWRIATLAMPDVPNSIEFIVE